MNAPQQTENLQKANEMKQEPLEIVETDSRIDDLLMKVFEQSTQSTEIKPQQKSYKFKKSTNDQQINDGLSFPRQIQSEKKQLNEPTLSDDVYAKIFEEKVAESKESKEIPEKIEEVEKIEKVEKVEEEKHPKIQKHVRISEDSFEEHDGHEKHEQFEDLEKYGKEETPQKSSQSQNPDEFSKVFEDQDRPNETYDEYMLKPILTDFSFIEELVNESIKRRKQQQYRPEIDQQFRLSIVDEMSETSATPKDSTGSPISRRSLRDSMKERTLDEPLNEEDIFETSKEEELKVETTDYVNEFIDQMFDPINKMNSDNDESNENKLELTTSNTEALDAASSSPPQQMKPLHVDVNTEPLQSSTLKRGQFNQNKIHEMNDSGIGIDMSSGSSSLTIEFPLLYSSKQEADDSTFTADELKTLIDQPLDHWPKKQSEQQTTRPKFESFIQEETQREKPKFLKKEEQKTVPIYSEAEIWSILGHAQEKQERRESLKGAKRQISRKRWSESSDNVSSDSTYEPGRKNSVDLDIKMRSISPSPLSSSMDEPTGKSTLMQLKRLVFLKLF